MHRTSVERVNVTCHDCISYGFKFIGIKYFVEQPAEK
jgi:hypothetical protein